MGMILTPYGLSPSHKPFKTVKGSMGFESKMPNRAYLLILLVACAALVVSGCVSSNPGAVWHEETGIGVCPPWRKISAGREKARRLAIHEAREKLQAALLKEKIDDNTSVEDVAIASPRFLSRFRGMIANARLSEIPSGEESVIVVKAQIDKSRVLRLARKYAPKAKVSTPIRSEMTESAAEEVEPSGDASDKKPKKPNQSRETFEEPKAQGGSGAAP